MASAASSPEAFAGRRLRCRAVGFCGADDSTTPELLRAVSERYEWVEWGVLFREDKQGTPRYASPAWVSRLGVVNQPRRMRLAAHLCSDYCTQVLRGDASFVARMHHDVGFNRVQVGFGWPRQNNTAFRTHREHQGRKGWTRVGGVDGSSVKVFVPSIGPHAHTRTLSFHC